MIQTTTLCKNCPETSYKTSTEEFFMLRVPVASTLDQSLEDLLKEKEDSRKCPKCSQSLIEQRNLIKLAEVIIVHFNRFDFGRSCKNKDKVNFGLKDVDFGKYLPKSEGTEKDESKKVKVQGKR